MAGYSPQGGKESDTAVALSTRAPGTRVLSDSHGMKLLVAEICLP